MWVLVMEILLVLIMLNKRSMQTPCFCVCVCVHSVSLRQMSLLCGTINAAGYIVLLPSAMHRYVNAHPNNSMLVCRFIAFVTHVIDVNGGSCVTRSAEVYKTFLPPPLRGNMLAVQGYMWHARYVVVYLVPIHDIL